MVMFKKIKNLEKINVVKLFKLQQLEKKIIYLLVFAVFILANFLVSFVSFRFDLSFGHVYTLSDATKNILRHLDDVVNIKFFVSSDLPTRLLPLKTEVTDFLNEYKKAGGNKIIIKIIDPKKDQSSLEQAQNAGIPELQFSQLEADKYAVTASYFGIAIEYGDKKEVIAQATDSENLEYNLTAAIYKLNQKKLPKIGILGIEDSVDPQEDRLYSLKKVFAQQFEIVPIQISSESAKTKIPSDYKSILVFDSDEKRHSQLEVEAIENYLKKGGAAVFFVDGVWVLDSLQTEPADHNFFNLIKNRGIEINKNLVLSTSAELVNFGNETMQFFTPYPFWIKTNNFNNQIGYFSNINQLTFPWVSSLTIKKKSGFATTELVKTTKRSWQQKDNFVLNPQNIPQPQTSELKEFIVAAQSTEKNGGKIVVIPSSRFVQERYLTRLSDNLELTLNLLNDLASGGVLSGIRQRAVAFYPLPDLPSSQKDSFKYLNILFLPAVFVVFGGLRLAKRR